MRPARHSQTGSLLSKLLVLVGLSLGCGGQGGDRVETAVISPDGKYFAQATGPGTTVHEVATGKKVKELRGAPAWHLRFSADSRYLASAGLTDLTLWDWAEGEALATWKGTNRHCFKMDFSGDGSLLAAADDNSLRVWETGKQRPAFNVPLPHEMDSLAFSPDGRLLAVAGTEEKEEGPRSHEVTIWEVPSGRAYATLRGPEYCIVKSLAFSPDGDHLATGLSVQAARLWAVRTKKAVWEQQVGNVDYDILTFSADGKRLAVGGYQSLFVLDAAKGTVIKEHELPGGRITSLAASPKPPRLLVTKGTSVHSIDLHSGRQEVLFPK